MTPDVVKRVLIFRYGQLGDTLVVVPALWLIRQQHPDAEIILLSENPLSHHITPRAVLPVKGMIDAFWTFNNPCGWRKLTSLPGLVRRIRAQRFDMLYYLAPRLRGERWPVVRDLWFFRFLCGLQCIAGHTGAERLVMPATRPLPTVASEAESLLDRLGASGIPLPRPEALRKDLALTDVERDQATRWLADHGLDADQVVRAVAVGIGSKWPSKQWPLERFQALGRRLIDELGVTPVIFGGPEDVPAARRLVESWGRGAVAAGDMNVRSAAATMERMALYVGNDTGTMHLAAAAGLRCVGIYSAQDWPGKWSPIGVGHQIHRVHVDCEGCRLAVCDRRLECLTQIEVDQVFASCRALFHP